MFTRKTLWGLALSLMLIASAVAPAYAAPAYDGTGTTITGTIQSITTSTDSSGTTIVVVTLDDGSGTTQTVNLSVADAVTLGLVTENPDGSLTVADGMVGQSITIDSSLIQADPCSLPDGANQPVGEALTSFFCKGLGIDYSTIEDYHSNGFGFGEIAQACFMAQLLGGDASLCTSILDAKKGHDFSGLTLPDGTTVNNWGQLRKAVFQHEAKSLFNLGAIMSGRAQDPAAPAAPAVIQHGNGNSNGNGNGNSNGHGHGNNGHGKP